VECQKGADEGQREWPKNQGRGAFEGILLPIPANTQINHAPWCLVTLSVMELSTFRAVQVLSEMDRGVPPSHPTTQPRE
jgi:hypothetical protein